MNDYTANLEYNERLDKFMVDDDDINEIMAASNKKWADKIESLELLLAAITQDMYDLRKQLEQDL